MNKYVGRVRNSYIIIVQTDYYAGRDGTELFSLPDIVYFPETADVQDMNLDGFRQINLSPLMIKSRQTSANSHAYIHNDINGKREIYIYINSSTVKIQTD